SLLGTHHLTDHESTHEAACAALAKTSCPRFQNLELVVADGFTDFTSTQHEIFRLLSKRAGQLFISLPKDPDSSRPDLFAKTKATLDELQRNFPQLELRNFDRRLLQKPTLDYLTQYVFANPKQIPAPPPSPTGSPPQIEIIAAASVQDEITQVARRIKTLLT